MIAHAEERFDQEGNMTDVITKEFILALLQNLVEWTRRIGTPPRQSRSEGRMTQPKRFQFTSTDGLSVACVKWVSSAARPWSVQIAHGLGEHMGRYAETGRRPC